jgi:phosphoribosylformimino-5-aminoimidazole carboxamide ribotide isomerase
MSFTIYPAIDVRDGRVVRLRQGDYAQETRYAEEPLALAQRYASLGAGWLHLVDLDAARTGGNTLSALVSGIKATTSLRVQAGGGVRGKADIDTLLAAGADRVVVGSMAVREPQCVCGWLGDFGAERITVALDARWSGDRWQLPAHGWTEGTGAELEPLLVTFAAAGLRHLLCTDIARDGMLSGPNIELCLHILDIAPDLRLQASGGVRSIADVLMARTAGCAGAVLGKALLDGRFELAEALQEAAC